MPDAAEKALQPLTFHFWIPKVHLTFLPACAKEKGSSLRTWKSLILQFSLAMTKGQFIQIRKTFLLRS